VGYVHKGKVACLFVGGRWNVNTYSGDLQKGGGGENFKDPLSKNDSGSTGFQMNKHPKNSIGCRPKERRGLKKGNMGKYPLAKAGPETSKKKDGQREVRKRGVPRKTGA